MNGEILLRRYRLAQEQYAEWGIDTDVALQKLAGMSISVHCWQGDDVRGFEGKHELTGGLVATGHFLGRARTHEHLQDDFEKVLSFVPGKHRFNLHAMYLYRNRAQVDRDQIEPRHFRKWVDWAKSIGIALDFNPTFFSHQKSEDGLTLSHRSPGVREFWIEHGKRCREIAAYFGRELGSPCVNNFWIPDGWKDLPADRLRHVNLLIDSLDKIFDRELDPAHTMDSVESKLFGIGSETFVVGSHEFYLGYALSRGLMLTMDAGHYHPTESVADKIPALLPFLPKMMMHVSRPVRWDSDHVVLFDRETCAIMREIARARAWDRVRIALDFFDASINRVGAWTIGIRNTQKAILFALLEPIDRIRVSECDWRLADRLALQEETKSLPFGAVWDWYCSKEGVPVGTEWLEAMKRYEREVLWRREDAYSGSP